MPQHKFEWTPRKLEALRAMRANGFTTKEIGRVLGCNERIIMRACVDNGVTLGIQAATVRRQARPSYGRKRRCLELSGK